MRRVLSVLLLLGVVLLLLDTRLVSGEGSFEELENGEEEGETPWSPPDPPENP